MSDTSLAVREGRRLSADKALQHQLPPTIRLLGPLQLQVGGRRVPLSRRQRELVALLAMSPNRVVPSSRLVDQLWDGTPPPGAAVTLRSYVSNVRASLAEASGAGLRVITVDAGYQLEVDPEAIDVVRFQRLVAAGQQRLRAGDAQASLGDFEEALDLWCGDPYADVAEHAVSTPHRVELTELHAGAVEGRLRALLELGRHVEAVPRLEALIADEPLREGPYELLMLALYRAGRSADALDVHRRYRRLVRDELGLEPSARLDQLLTAVLHRDPRLDPAGVAADAAHEQPDSEPAAAAAQNQALTVLVADLIEALRTVSDRAAEALQLLDAVTPGPDAGRLEPTSVAAPVTALHPSPVPASPPVDTASVATLRSRGGVRRPSLRRGPAASRSDRRAC